MNGGRVVPIQNLTGWRVDAAQKALEVQDDLDSTTTPNQACAAQVEAHLSRAVTRINASQDRPFWMKMKEWWTGEAMDDAWESIHQARTRLTYCLDDDKLVARKSYLTGLAKQEYSKDQAAAAAELFKDTMKDPPASTVAAHDAAALLVGYSYTRSDRAHTQVRSFRNLIYLFTLLVLAFDLALWLTGVTSGTIVGLGALAGAVSGVFSLLKRGPSGSYNLKPAQTLVKVVVGAATALLAVKIIHATTASAETLTAGTDELIAILFGFSQQAFTYLVDQKAAAYKDDVTPSSEKAQTDNKTP